MTTIATKTTKILKRAVRKLTVKAAIKLPTVCTKAPYLGCDPEFFFKVDGEVIGAEKILPKEGLAHTPNYEGKFSKFIIDGVQAELNPRPNHCRANLANEIRACFEILQKELDKNKKVSCDFSRSIQIPAKNLAELDENNQKFGCMPSKTIYEASGLKLADVDATKHLQRSAGGHIHISQNEHPSLRNKIKDAPEEVIKMLDIICGNTCVLVDRDEGNVIRRKLYGRAGEYRLPPHGIEYRTLSNFWLEAYPLMSLAFGLARLAVELIADEINGPKYYKAFTEAVDHTDIQKAINENDFKLAYKNFKKIEPLLISVTTNETKECYDSGHWPLKESIMPEFHYFIKTVNTKGLKHFFKQDPMTHWTNLPEAHNGGFFDFLRRDVRAEMKTKKTRKKKVAA